MALHAFVAPILPGKTESWKRFAGELAGARKDEFDASRKEIGVRERVYFQSTPDGDYAIVTWEGAEPEKALDRMANLKGAFADWFLAQVKEHHGLDLRTAKLEPPELMVDSQSARPSAPSFAHA